LEFNCECLQKAQFVNTWVDQLVVVAEKLKQLVHSQPQKPCLVPTTDDHPRGNAQTTSLQKKNI